MARVQWVDTKPELAILDKDDAVSKVVSFFAKTYEGYSVSVVSQTDDKSKAVLLVSASSQLLRLG